MGKKILINLDAYRLELLNNFVKEMDLKYQVDGIRLLIDLSQNFTSSNDSSNDSLMLSAGPSGVMIIKNGVMKVMGADCPEIEEVSVNVNYTKGSEVLIKSSVLKNI